MELAQLFDAVCSALSELVTVVVGLLILPEAVLVQFTVAVEPLAAAAAPTTR